MDISTRQCLQWLKGTTHVLKLVGSQASNTSGMSCFCLWHWCCSYSQDARWVREANWVSSRTLNSAEQNYSHLEKEGLPLVFGIKWFYWHLTTLITNHKQLPGLLDGEKPTSPQALERIRYCQCWSTSWSFGTLLLTQMLTHFHYWWSPLLARYLLSWFCWWIISRLFALQWVAEGQLYTVTVTAEHTEMHDENDDRISSKHCGTCSQWGETQLQIVKASWI